MREYKNKNMRNIAVSDSKQWSNEDKGREKILETSDV